MSSILNQIFRWPSIPEYGNYGGPGRSGERTNSDGTPYHDPLTQQTVPYDKNPVDELDALFKAHDLGYDVAKANGDRTLGYLLADAALLIGMKNLDPSLLDSYGKTYREAAIRAFQMKVLVEMPSVLRDVVIPPDMDPLTKWREKLRNPTSPNDPRLPDPANPNTYRIVWVGGDPLVLDLDGDGVETVAPNGHSGALFDHNNDGIKTATGWIKGDDGLLVRDLNGNDTIDSGAELFGDNTLLANGAKAANGFIALRDIDSNGDGKIDANDTAFSQLKIWRDTNQDGISQADELKTLSELGIESLNTSAANTIIPTQAGPQILTGSFTRTDGSTSTMADINFTQDNFHSEYVDHIDVPEALQDLPSLHGMGRLRDLKEAATLSPALANVLTQYAAAETRTEQKALLGQLLFEWAKTDPSYSASPVEVINSYRSLQYDTNSTNVIYLRVGQSLPVYLWDIPKTYADTALQQHTRIVDAALGDRVTTILFDTISSQSADMNKSYTALADAIYADLLTQTRFKKYFDAVELNITETSIFLDTSKVAQLFQDRIASDPVNGLTDLIEFNKYAGDMLTGTRWDGIGMMENALRTQTITPEIQALYQELNVSFSGTPGGINDDIILGDEQNRTISGSNGNDMLLGGSGNETLAGGNDDDVLSGGAGNDELRGESGNDTYIFRRGSGNDRIIDGKGTNSIIFAGLNPNDITVRTPNQYNDDFIFTINASGETLNVSSGWNWGWNWGTSWYENTSIGSFVFSDGTVWNMEDALRAAVLKPTEGDDTIIGSRLNDSIQGLSGNDTIIGRGGDDVIDSGAGDDTLIGGAYIYNDCYTGQQRYSLDVGANGNDTYLFGRGDGHDTIIDGDNTLNSDKLKFKDGVAPSDVAVNRTGNDLMLTIKDTGDSVTMRDYFKEVYPGDPAHQDYEIERIEFSDGALWTATTFHDLLLSGTDANDTIIGYRQEDTITGGAGNDYIDARSGNDVISGGDGNDTINAGLGDDIIDGGKGDDIINGRDSRYYDVAYEQPRNDNDTYLFGWSDGHDTISNRSESLTNSDTIRFKEGVSASDIRFEGIPGYNEDLRIVLGDGTDSITVSNWFASPYYQIGRLEFSDGTVLDPGFVASHLAKEGTQENDIILGSAKSETISGYAGDDTVHAGYGNDLVLGGTGNDTLYGEDGNDVLDGGTGDDMMVGGFGDDTYRFGRGDSHDTAYEGFGSGYYWVNSPNDAIEFKPGVLQEDVIVRRSGNDMVLTIKGTEDQLTVKGTFNEST
ncbi:MAG: calcium-binding protein, partial [Pedobacter sp.]